MKNNQSKPNKPKTALAKTPASAPVAEDKKNVLLVTSRPGVSEERQMADLATGGIVSNAMTARQFLDNSQPGLSITDMVNSLNERGQRVNGNDLAASEQMLTAQSVALNAIFTELARRSALNMGQYLDASERYMRLALKAQGQCRATVETLAAIKNPPIVYAKQANINNGGNQQFNNGVLSGPKEGVAGFSDASTPAHAHGNNGIEQTKLLEGIQHGGTVLDAGTTRTTIGGNPTMEAVGAVNRPKERRRQGQGQPKRVEGRHSAASA